MCCDMTAAEMPVNVPRSHAFSRTTCQARAWLTLVQPLQRHHRHLSWNLHHSIALPLQRQWFLDAQGQRQHSEDRCLLRCEGTQSN